MRRIGVVLVVVGVLGCCGSAQGSVRADAKRTYDRLWQKADRFYGAEGQRAPAFAISTPGSFGSLRTDRTGLTPVVYAKPWVMRDLAGRGARNRAGRYEGHANRYKMTAEKSLLHEWAHVFQTPAVWDDPALAELDASQFARNLAARIIARHRRKLGPLNMAQFG